MKKIIRSALFLAILPFFCWNCAKSTQNSIQGLKISVPDITEGNSDHPVQITIVPEGIFVTAFDAGYEVTEGSARFNQDIKQASGTLTFKPGQSGQTISLIIIGDTFPELTENFELRITYNNTTITRTISITDDDPLESVLTDADGFYTSRTHPSMELVWQDEFEDTTLNLNDWSPELGNGCDKGICGWGNQELESYTDQKENLRLEKGRLIITALKEASGYTSARIKTEGKVEVQFGRIDIRAKLPMGQGLWPAIWMLGTNISTVGWPACGEIDIMEMIGKEPNVVHGTVHYDENGHKSSGGSYSLSQEDFSERFHVFSLVWDQDRMEWYVDNEKFKTFNKANIVNYPFNAPFYFIFNVAVGGAWPGNPDATTVFPQSMTVDYIRVYH
ncbi:MAG: family 16 glycosylhydrolase [Bacteroidales bacterium]|nr:family 16 glycosylhydrolase [Bacteroidales bacterium]